MSHTGLHEDVQGAIWVCTGVFRLFTPEHAAVSKSLQERFEVGTQTG